MNPEFEDETPLNPFDLWAGANFKLKIRKVEGYSNYDKSEFEGPSVLFEDDDEMEKVWKREYPLVTFLERKNFKTYDEVKSRLSKVLALEGVAAAPQARQQMWEQEDASPPRAAAPKAAPKADVAPWDSQEDDDLAMFQKLAND
jgi:hypothetical protein